MKKLAETMLGCIDVEEELQTPNLRRRAVTLGDQWEGLLAAAGLPTGWAAGEDLSLCLNPT